jgi:integrase
MDNPNVALSAPATENRTVRRPNAELRTREHLTVGEVEQLIEVAGSNRQGYRDALMILLAFRHGLRAAEVCDLRWEQIDFNAATLHVRRIKNGTPATHPLTGRELRALRKHHRETARYHARLAIRDGLAKALALLRKTVAVGQPSRPKPGTAAPRASQGGDPEWQSRKKRRDERSLANTTAGLKNTPTPPA